MNNITTITEEQQKINFDVCMARLDAVQTTIDLARVSTSVHKDCTPERGGNLFFMNKNQKTEFWAAYNVLKAKFNEEVQKEIQVKLEEADSVQIIKQLKYGINKQFVLSKEEKADYQQMCAEKISELEQAA